MKEVRYPTRHNGSKIMVGEDASLIRIRPMGSWIEAGFKDRKRGGFRWEQTKMTDPQRVERLWLVMSIALLYLISVGLATDPGLTLYQRGHQLSCLQRGWLAWLVHLITQRALPQPVFFGYVPHSVPFPKDTYP
jgi:hypothetical protein